MIKLTKDFYMQDTLTVAKELIGKYIIHNTNGLTLSGRITETEAYCGALDKACHSYGMKKTKRNQIMYSLGGVAYVYLIYGMHYCFNVVTGDVGNPSAVLVRAIEPVSGTDDMALSRYGKTYNELSCSQKSHLADGPGKLCKAMSITGKHNGIDLCGSVIHLNDIGGKNPDIITTARVNIDYAEEFAQMPWRFLLKKQ